MAWFVSHCDTPSKREKYVERMRKIIPVDIYGYCSDNKTLEAPKNSNEESKLLSSYKFYLSFENSKCPEYVTEKLYRVIHFDTLDNPPIPVVMGPKKSWYKDNLPPKSFIHVDDFNTPEELASHLIYLTTNHEMYLSYLNWRQNHYKFCEPKVRCRLCDYLLKTWNGDMIPNTPINGTNLIISDFKSFWQKANCYD